MAAIATGGSGSTSGGSTSGGGSSTSSPGSTGSGDLIIDAATAALGAKIDQSYHEALHDVPVGGLLATVPDVVTAVQDLQHGHVNRALQAGERGLFGLVGGVLGERVGRGAVGAAAGVFVGDEVYHLGQYAGSKLANLAEDLFGLPNLGGVGPGAGSHGTPGQGSNTGSTSNNGRTA